MITHIVKKETWEQAKEQNVYKGDTLESEGFIHCSKPDQVTEVANYIYKGEKNLVLLVIDESKVESEIKYEGIEDGEKYPHIYGPINVDSVEQVVDFPAQEDGTFILPKLD